MCDYPLFPSFKTLLVFFDCIFFSSLLVYQREIWNVECVGMCFGGVAVALVNSNSSSKSKLVKFKVYCLELLKVGYRIFLDVSQNLAIRILQ